MENEARNDCFKKNKIIYYVKWVESMTKKSYEERMHSTDAKIIEILQDNGRICMKDLGIAVGLTSPAVSERVKRLEEAKIISGYKAIINPDSMGRAIKAFINVSLPGTAYDAFIDAVKNDPRIVECHHITGDDSSLIKVIVESMDELENVIDNLKDFGRTRTSVILSTPIQAKSIL